MLKKIYIILFTILSISSFYNCKKTKQRRFNRPSSIPVEVIRVKKQSIKTRLFLTGDIKGIEEVNIYSFVTGILKNKYVTEGQRVIKGQALFSVDQTIRGMDMRDYVILSPISGVISGINIDTGAQVMANQSVIASVVKTRLLKAEVYVPETEINKVKVGNEALVKASAAPGKAFKGKVFRISPVVNVNNRMAKVEILIPEHGNLLKSGMFAEIEIFTSIIENKILIPLECVIYGDNITYIFKFNKEKKVAEKHIVVLGKNYSGRIVVKRGLIPGDVIISKGSYEIFDGFPVHTVNKQKKKNNTQKSK